MDSKNDKQSQTNQLLRLPDVLTLFPVSRSRWYAGIKAGEYPAPVKVSANISAWRSEEINALIKQLTEKSGIS